MSEETQGEGAPPPRKAGPIQLDPFGFAPQYASRIPGLGGAEPGPDPSYVFHTPYVAAARGPANFHVTFENARARLGTLTLRVHMIPDEPGAIARLVNSERIQLNRLVRNEGQISIGFEGFRGVTYAVMGLIVDRTDVEASGIVVTLDRPALADEGDASHVDARSTLYGTDAMLPTARMVSDKRALLALPVSQACTAEQFDESAYGEWIARLGVARDRTLEQWSTVYRLQALSTYGMLQAGAAGLGIAEADDLFVQALGAAGVGAACAEPGTERRILAMDPLYPPADLVNFDFLWSCDSATQLGNPADVIVFALNAMSCLRPGGLAIFMFPTTDAETGSAGEGRLGRLDLERLSLTLISHSFEVAQLRLAGVASVGLFGLIARKPRSAY